MASVGNPVIDRGQPNSSGEARLTLDHFKIEGFQAFAKLEIGLRPINVLIGGNGCGKSGLMNLFRMLRATFTQPGQFQHFVGSKGGASRLLHYGPKRTKSINIELRLKSKKGTNEYRSSLYYVASDTLRFSAESYRYIPNNASPPFTWTELGDGQAESAMLQNANDGHTPRVIAALIREISVYQFHDTGETSRIRQTGDMFTTDSLAEDGSNLAQFLFSLSRAGSHSLARITETVKLVFPTFSGFWLSPTNKHIRLQWREMESDYIFDAHQASDGTLRFMCLAALLLQPPDRLPPIIFLDEPELGLHPHAIKILADLLRIASVHSQLIIATQSSTLVDQFEAIDIVVFERHGGKGEAKRVDPEELSSWLSEFDGITPTLSDLWESNIFGGGLTR